MVFTRKYILQLAAGKDENSGGTPEPKKVTINGKEMLLSDLQQAALQDAHRWALYLNLSADLEKAFNDALSTVLEGIGNGTRYENGRYYGTHGNNQEYYGKLSGEKKNGARAWNGMKREGYDAFGNVIAYLNGKTGSIKSSSALALTATTNTNKLKWSSNSIGSHVYRNLFELMDPSEINMTKWADEADDKFDETTGLRGTAGRRKLLLDALTDLNLDKYDLNDEDKARYNNLLTLARGEDTAVSELALRKLGLGKFLFTTNDYESTPMTDEEKKAAEEKRKLEALKAELDKYNLGYLNWLNLSYSDDLNYNLLWDNNLNAEGLETIDNIIANGYDWDNFLSNLNNDLTSNYSGLNMDSYWRSRNLYDSSSPESWNYDMMLHQGIFGAAYINAFNPNMYAGAIGARLGSPDINPLLYRLMAYNNLLSRLKETGGLDNYTDVNDPSKKYSLKVGNNLYLIVDSMDKDGNVLVYNYDTNNPTITRTNVRKFKDRTDLRDLFELIGNRYAKLNGINLSNSQELQHSLSFHKEGGILKFQLGANLVAARLLENQAKLAELEALSPKEREKVKLDNRELNKGLTTTDYLRLGSLAADLTSAAAAWAPGVGTGVSLATGLTGTAASFMADWKEGDKNLWSNLGTGLAMDVVGLVPGLGSAGKAGKIAKTLVKWAPRLITMASAANMAPEFINTLKKATDSKAKLTAKDLRVLSKGVSALAGVSRMGAASYNKRLIDNKAKTGQFTALVKDKNGATKEITLNSELATALKTASNKAAADAVVKLVDNEATSMFTDKKEFGWKSPSSWFSKNLNNSNVLEKFDYTRVIENTESPLWINNLAQFYSHFGLNPNKTNMLRIMEAREFSLGKLEPQSNRFKSVEQRTEGVPLANAGNKPTTFDLKLHTSTPTIGTPLILPKVLPTLKLHTSTPTIGTPLILPKVLPTLKLPKIQPSKQVLLTPRALGWINRRANAIMQKLEQKGVRAKDPKQLRNKVAARHYLNWQRAMRLAEKDFIKEYPTLLRAGHFKEGGELIPMYWWGGDLWNTYKKTTKKIWSTVPPNTYAVAKGLYHLATDTPTTPTTPDLPASTSSNTGTPSKKTTNKPTLTAGEQLVPETPTVTPSLLQVPGTKFGTHWILASNGSITRGLDNGDGTFTLQGVANPVTLDNKNYSIFDINNPEYLEEAPEEMSTYEYNLLWTPNKELQARLDQKNGINPTAPDERTPKKTPMGSSMDLLPTGLELAKFLGTSKTNKAIDDIKLDPVLAKTPELKARLVGLWDFLNQGNATAANIDRMGRGIANASADLGAGTAARLNAAYKAAGVISNALAKYNDSVLKSLANVLATANLNTLNRVATSNANDAAIVANNNLDKIKHMLYLNKENANKTNLYNTMLLGHLVGALLRYQNAYNNYLMSLPEWNQYNEYTQRIGDLIAINPSFDWNTTSEGWTQADVDGYRQANSAINRAGTLWKQRNNPTMPYAFAWFKNGGKMAEAEREKNRRAAARLFFETVKHTNTMSLRAIKDSGHMSMYLLKRMMQGK